MYLIHSFHCGVVVVVVQYMNSYCYGCGFFAVAVTVVIVIILNPAGASFSLSSCHVLYV